MDNSFPYPFLPDGVDTATSTRPSVTLTGGAANTLSASFTELEASLSADSGGIYMLLTSGVVNAGNNASALVKFYTGASSSEVLWATVSVGFKLSHTALYIPGFIAAGTRISAKCQGAQVSQAVSFTYAFMDVGPDDIGPPVTLGEVTASSRGTTITPHASVNTKSAWTEISSNIGSDPLCALLVCVAHAGDAAFGSGGLLVDIGVGAAAAETVLIADIPLLTQTSEDSWYLFPSAYSVTVAAGARLSARYQRSTGADSCDVMLVGATLP